MLSVENIRSLTDFRRNSKDFVEKLQASQQPMVLTVNGEAAVVVQDAKSFQASQDRLVQLEAELSRLKLDALRHDVQLGIEQVNAGQFVSYTEESAGELADRIKANGRRRNANQ